jgi:hypothetical protein
MDVHEDIEFQPPNAKKYTGEDTVAGAGINFTFDVDILDEEEYTPVAGNLSTLLRKKGEKYEKERKKW